MERVLILSADVWDMTDERTGRPMSAFLFGMLTTIVKIQK